MPKTVDHETRRAELAAAVWRVIKRSGIVSATVRAVATEAGVSPGALRHYFSDQTGLVQFAAELMTERVVERLLQHLERGESGPEAGVRILEELLPFDDERQIEVAVWLEVLTRARFDPQMAKLTTVGWFGERHVCRIAWAVARGVTVPDSPDERFSDAVDESTVDLLHTFVDGLTLQAATSPAQLPAEVVAERLDSFVRFLLSSAGSNSL